MRYGNAGWLDWGMMTPTWPVALWNISMADEDWQRIEFLREREIHDWNNVWSFHSKEDAGHEQPWVRFVAGDNPTYPERILDATHSTMSRRLGLTRGDRYVGTRHHVHHWQWANPVSSEALVQLTLGGPQQIHNGGLLHARLPYFDVQRKRMGLPEDVDALVETLERERTVVRLVNLNPHESRQLIVQAGALREHRFSSATYDVRERMARRARRLLRHLGRAELDDGGTHHGCGRHTSDRRAAAVNGNRSRPGDRALCQ